MKTAAREKCARNTDGTMVAISGGDIPSDGTGCSQTRRIGKAFRDQLLKGKSENPFKAHPEMNSLPRRVTRVA